MNILEANHVQKVYSSRFSAGDVMALKDISFGVNKGEFIAIMGESGSGKSTLLNILATIDQPTKGEVLIDGVTTNKLKGKDLSAFRRNRLGFVFQDYSLLDTFSNKDNILLPLVLNGEKPSQMEPKLYKVVQDLEIESLLSKRPHEVSGGQKQRIACARALITQPDILLADEPTGALDSKNSQDLLELFENLNQKGQTLIMVTHSVMAASYASRVLFIKDGQIYHELYKGNQGRIQFYDEIIRTQSVMNAKEGERYGG